MVLPVDVKSEHPEKAWDGPQTGPWRTSVPGRRKAIGMGRERHSRTQ